MSFDSKNFTFFLAGIVGGLPVGNIGAGLGGASGGYTKKYTNVVGGTNVGGGLGNKVFFQSL